LRRPVILFGSPEYTIKTAFLINSVFNNSKQNKSDQDQNNKYNR
jgi:hypothetical protein